jgi:DNA-binding transcriptional LysR family regulator
MKRKIFYKGVQLPQLRSFCVAATSGNFTTAAKELGLSVPTVWQQVRGLERELDATLLRRRGRIVEMTPEGRLLLDLIRPHVSGLDSLASLFKARRVELPQLLTIASTYYLVGFHLPRPVQEFTTRYPAVRLNLRPGLWVDALRLVERGEADIGVIPYDPDEPRSPAIEYEPLFEMKLMLLTAASHPLAGKKQLRPRDLVEYPMVLQPRENYGHRMLERVLRRENLLDRMQVVMESQSTHALMKYVALGVGIAVVYLAPQAAESMPEVQLRVFDPKLPGLPVAVIHRKGAHLTPAVEAFRDELHRLLASRPV